MIRNCGTKIFRRWNWPEDVIVRWLFFKYSRDSRLISFVKYSKFAIDRARIKNAYPRYFEELTVNNMYVQRNKSKYLSVYLICIVYSLINAPISLAQITVCLLSLSQNFKEVTKKFLCRIKFIMLRPNKESTKNIWKIWIGISKRGKNLSVSLKQCFGSFRILQSIIQRMRIENRSDASIICFWLLHRCLFSFTSRHINQLCVDSYSFN